MERGSVRETADRAYDGRVSRPRGRGDRFRDDVAQPSPQHAVPEQRRGGVRDQGGGRSIAAQIQQTGGGMAAEHQAGGAWHSGAATRVGRAGGLRGDRAATTHRLPRGGGARRGAQAVPLRDTGSRDPPLLSSGLKDFLHRARTSCAARIGTRERSESTEEEKIGSGLPGSTSVRLGNGEGPRGEHGWKHTSGTPTNFTEESSRARAEFYEAFSVTRETQRERDATRV